MEVNLSLVFECLRHHDPGNSAAQKDSLLTIASLCSENDEAKNIFRENGGLGYVLNMLTTVTDDGVRGTVLYTLGCATERNVYSQRRLCSDALFKYLLCQITSVRASIKLKRSAAFLLTCLVTNNSAGQNLIQSSSCIDGLLNSLNSLSSSASEDLQKALCFDIIKTLCSCVNNPRHEGNQVLCAAAFPVVLKLLKKDSDVEVIELLASFVSLTVANCETNQERLGLLGGINLITSCLQNMLQTLLKQPNHQLVNAISGLVTALGISCCDHEMNIQTLTELKVIPLLVQVLSLEVVSAEVKLKVILTISVITRSSEISQKQLVDCDGMVLLVNMLMENQNNEEMTKAITSVLQSCVGWVSTLGTENMLYSKTLSAVHVSSPRETDKLNAGQVPMGKSEILHPLTPVQLEKAIPSDSRCIKCHKEMKSNTGSVVHSVTSDGLGKLQTQVGHLEEKFNLVLRYLDTPRHQQSIGLDGKKQIKYEKHRNLEEMMNVIREKTDGKCEIYQKRGRDGDTVKGVDTKPGELFDKARKQEKIENKRYIGKNNISSSANSGNDHGHFLHLKNIDGVTSQKDLKEQSSGWKVPLPCKQVSQDEHHGIESHCYEGGGGAHGYTFCGKNRMVSLNGPVTGCDQKDDSDSKFSSANKQSRGDSQACVRHSKNLKCIRQNGRKSLTVTDAEQFTKSGDKMRDDLSSRCKQRDGCQSGVRPLDINRDTRAIKQTTGNLKESFRLHSHGNTRKSGIRKTGGGNYNYTTYAKDAIEDVGKRKGRHQSTEWNQHLSLDGSRYDDGLKEPECAKDQLLSNKTFVKAAVKATRHICSGHNDRGLVIAVKEGNNLAIRKLASRRSVSVRRSRKSISTFSESDSIRDLLSDLPCNSSCGTKRRKRQDFSPDEVHHLIEEVKRQGKHWNSILWSGNFKKGRTAVDLKDKYRRLVASNLRQKNCRS